MSVQINEISLLIDDIPVTVSAGTTILHAAEKIGIKIPRLCYHPALTMQGSCRVCIVEVEGLSSFVTACSTPVEEGMKVRSASPEIRQARRDIVELLLDNHPRECQTCERDGHCELQNLAYETGVRERLFEGERKEFAKDENCSSVIRDPEKCVLCGRCVRVCAEVQGVKNLSQHGRGFHTVVTPANGKTMDQSTCIQCGQCINVCPTAAFLERNATDQVWEALDDSSKHVVVHVAPAIRAAIGEGFGLPPGTSTTKQLPVALRRLGFDRVFDTNVAADLTIWEEAHEFVHRLKNGGPLPLLTSCSPGWISFLERFYPELIPNASTCKSPMSMLSTMIKTYYAEKNSIDPKDIFVVSVMPCVAKKFEAARPELAMEDGTPYTDAVITTRELIWMIKSFGMNLAKLPEGEFDTPLGISSGSADIFGTTGGVMEATLRAVCEMVTGNPPECLEFKDVRAVEGLRRSSIELDGSTFNLGVANGLNNAKILLDELVSGKSDLHVMEVMACPGGCVGGGGQPYPPEGERVLNPELIAKRAQALYTIDEAKTIRQSLASPVVKQLYEEFLGEPSGEKAHKLLHTNFQARLPRGIR